MDWTSDCVSCAAGVEWFRFASSLWCWMLIITIHVDSRLHKATTRLALQFGHRVKKERSLISIRVCSMP